MTSDYLIERLRVSADHMDRPNSEMVHKAADRLEAAQEEIERLREELRKIERGRYDGLEVMPLSYTDSRAIARAALGEEG